MIICNQNIEHKMIKLGFQIGDHKNTRKRYNGCVIYRRKKYNIHLHVMKSSHKSVKNMIFFRDYIKSHPNKRKEYVKLKEEAVKLGKLSNDNYNKHKSEFIKSILEKQK